MSSDQRRTTVVRYWWSKAEESLASAEREMKAGSLGFAVNRIYYAAFYAVSAALLERQSLSKKHSGVRSAFHREFIKAGLLDPQWGRFYNELFEDRQEGDYVALVGFESEYVKKQLMRCGEFLTQLRSLISSLGQR